MKKWIALLLALTMCVGLLSVGVLADEPGQLYCDGRTSLSQPAGGGMSVALYTAQEGGDGNRINSTDYELSKTGEIGTVTWNGENEVRWDTNGTDVGTTGKIVATAKAGGAAYAIDVTVTEPYLGVYSADPTVNDSGAQLLRENNGEYTVEYTENEAKSVFIYLGMDSCAFTGEVTSANNKIAAVKTSDRLITVTLSEGNSGNIGGSVGFTVQEGEREPDNMSCNIKFTDGSQGGGDPGQGGNGGDQGGEGEQMPEPDNAERELEDSDVASLENQQYSTFELGGVTYRVGVCSWSADENHVSDGALSTGESGYYPWDNVNNMMRAVGFWYEDGTKVSKADLEIIKGAITNPTLTLYAVSGNGDTYPATWTSIPAPYGWPCASIFRFNNKTTGNWLFRASVTIGGEIYEADCPIFHGVSTGETFTPTAQGDAAIVEINEFFSAPIERDPNLMFYMVSIPAGEYNGVIEIPASFPYYVDISGADGPEPTTIINGGIKADNGLCNIANLKLVGAGKNSDEWTEGVNAGKPNDGFYGKAPGEQNNCVFTGFRYAVVCDDIRNGGAYCTFESNKVGLYITETNIETDGGNTYASHFVFSGNDTAIHFSSLRRATDPNWFVFDTCEFIGNTTDIRNTTGRMIFVPKAYFEDDEDNVWDGFTSRNNLVGRVSVYPTATSNELIEIQNPGSSGGPK